jgi:CubicO group peptidase (beta-lactamase class C family)
MQQHIFAPLGITNTTMFPTPDMQENMAHMHQRDPQTGAISERDHIYRRSCVQATKEDQQRFFHSGGAGLWSRLPEYVKVLGMLLNDGEGQSTGKRILKKETVDLMWENQIPDQCVPSRLTFFAHSPYATITS